MTAIRFCTALLAANVAYILGDLLLAAAVRRDSAALHRAGTMLVATACAMLCALFVAILAIGRLT